MGLSGQCRAGAAEVAGAVPPDRATPSKSRAEPIRLFFYQGGDYV